MCRRILTIAVTMYQQDEYIEELTMLLEYIKTLQEIELLVFDDNSKTSKSLDFIKKNKNRFNIIVNDTNHGSPSYSRNLAIKIATSKYLLFVDGDDLLSNNITEIIDQLKKSDEDVLISVPVRKTSEKISLNQSKYGNNIINDDDEMFDKNSFKYYCFNTGIFNIYKVEYLNEHNILFEMTYRNEDHIFNHLILSKRPKIGRIKSSYYIWRENLWSYSYSDGSEICESTLNLLSRQSSVLDCFIPSQRQIIWYNLFETGYIDLLRGYPELKYKQRKDYFLKVFNILGKPNKKFHFPEVHFYFKVYKINSSFLAFECTRMLQLVYKKLTKKE